MSGLRIPGGFWADGQLHRVAHIGPLTGILERSLAACADANQVLPHSVSMVLTNAIEKIGSLPMTAELAAQLTVGDRIFLMLQLAIRYLSDRVWLTPKCECCNNLFDVPVERSRLNVKYPEGEYPIARLEINGHTLELRSPNGEDQGFIAETQPEDAEMVLLRRCVVGVDGKEPEAELLHKLLHSKRNEIETAIERLSPHVDCCVSVRCPECKYVQRIDLEPYWLGELTDGALDAEVHTLAFHYHWSESEILGLSRDQRRSYCAFIGHKRHG